MIDRTDPITDRPSWMRHEFQYRGRRVVLVYDAGGWELRCGFEAMPEDFPMSVTVFEHGQVPREPYSTQDRQRIIAAGYEYAAHIRAAARGPGARMPSPAVEPT